MIHRVRRRATFAEFSRVRAKRSGPVWVRRVGGVGVGPAQVAFAIGKPVGNAVTRNRVRRRLRAAILQIESDLEPGTAYLVGVTPVAAEATFADLSRAVAVCIRGAA